MKFLKLALPFFLLALLFTACENEPQTKITTLDPALLIGKWELTGATVNKIPSPRLDGAYFEFADGGILKTNILDKTFFEIICITHPPSLVGLFLF